MSTHICSKYFTTQISFTPHSDKWQQLQHIYTKAVTKQYNIHLVKCVGQFQFMMLINFLYSYSFNYYNMASWCSKGFRCYAVARFLLQSRISSSDVATYPNYLLWWLTESTRNSYWLKIFTAIMVTCSWARQWIRKFSGHLQVDHNINPSFWSWDSIYNLISYL